MGKIRMRSRTRTLKAAVAAVALGGALVLAAGPSAFAVHDETFQLDGDVIASTTTSKGGTTQTIDWDSIFTSAGEKQNPLPTGFTAAVFSPDFKTNANGSFNTSDPTTYTTGSKDTLPISGWQCAASNNVNSKVDVMNAYATAFTAANGDQILYFALERNTNSGDANVAFWFLQDEVACNSNGGTGTFTGEHQNGDLLIVSAFSNDGSVSTIDAYKWARTAAEVTAGLPGSLDTTPVASAHGADCKSTAAGDNACATVNTANITTPWPTANFKDGVGNTLRSTEFYEGGLNLTKTGLGGHCFNSFTGDTRSSQSLTATLFDYSLGKLGECTSTTVTTPTPAAGSETVIPASGSAALTTSDSAKITVTGISTFSGTLKFFICGPSALTSTATCDTGGDQIGSTQTITTNGDYPSSSATITEVGRYCWRAEFSGDTTAGVPKSSDSSSGECFKVTPRQSALDTAAVASPVDFGQAVQDNATLTNTADHQGSGGSGTDGSIDPTTAGGKAGGTITFTLYKADCTTKATGTGTNPQSLTVSGDGTYGPVSFTPDAPGTYHWVAAYSGDSPNTLKSDHNVKCDDTDEDVVVRQIPTEITTAQKVYPNDSATVTSSVTGKNLPSGGTVTFRLYDTVANCKLHGDTLNSGGLLYKESASITGGAQSETVATHNWPATGVTGVAVAADSTVAWYVTYATGDTAFTGRQSDCVETTALTFTNEAGPGTVFPTPTP